MPETQEHRQKYLDIWLRQATKGLCAEAKARICDELTARFAEAAAAGRAAGLDEDEAAYRAYVALGDSWEARQKFSRVYLTEGEADMIRKLHTEPGAFWKICNGGYCLGHLLVLMGRWQESHVASDVYFIPVLMLATSICMISTLTLLICRRLSTGWRRFHKIIFCSSFFFFIVSSPFRLYQGMLDMDRRQGTCFAQMMIVSLVLLIMVFASVYYRIWRKWRHHSEVLQ